MKKLLAPLFTAAFILILSASFVPLAMANPWQWPAKGEIEWYYGMRIQPVIHVNRMHHGIDIKNVRGTRIYAARSGRVVAINRSARHTASNEGGGYGNYVVIRHRYRLYSIYAHLSKVLTVKGRWVRAGTFIGRMGSTGLTPDVHLHFGIGHTLWVNHDTVNPLKVLPER